MDIEMVGGAKGRGRLASADVGDIWKGFSMFSTYRREANYISSRLVKMFLCFKHFFCSLFL